MFLNEKLHNVLNIQDDSFWFQDLLKYESQTQAWCLGDYTVIEINTVAVRQLVAGRSCQEVMLNSLQYGLCPVGASKSYFYVPQTRLGRAKTRPFPPLYNPRIKFNIFFMATMELSNTPKYFLQLNHPQPKITIHNYLNFTVNRMQVALLWPQDNSITMFR